MTAAPDSARDSWIAERLHLAGHELSRLEQIHVGPSGYVLAADTTGGARFYFKGCNAVSAHEPEVSAALAARFPGAVPDVPGCDPAQGWLLLSDAGPTVKALTQADGDITRWDAMLRAFAALQQAAVLHVESLLAAGVPDRRPDRLPTLYAGLLADAGALLLDHPDGVSEADLARLQAYTPAVRELCARIASYNIPSTLEHDDFHVGNVGLRDGQYCFFDWGEAFIAHPFYSLMLALRYAKFVFHTADAALDHLREVYLGCWLDYEPIERLRELAALTDQLAALSRALTWRDAATLASNEFRADMLDAAPYWLLTFLNNTPLDY
ncbi:MAG: phosphotransferase [Chloroflexi bacterium]|nr:phosphotransferase [Chloroflexota bacterium]